MKIYNLKEYLPQDSMIGKMSLFISLMAVFVAFSMGETKCLSADSCSVGATEVMEGDLEIRSTGSVGTILKSTATTERTISFPDSDGTVITSDDFDPTEVLTLSSLTADKILQTNSSSELVLDDLPLIRTTDIDPTQGADGQVLITNGTDTIIWDDIDHPVITHEPDLVDVVVSGSENDQVRINASNELEVFTPEAGGGMWTLVASGESHTNEYKMSTYEDDDEDSVQICWGGASSTDGTDSSYFRMTDGKRYKLVFAPNNNTNDSIINSTSYGNMGISLIGSSVDCVDGAGPQSWTSAQGYGSSSMDWFYYWDSYSEYGGENSENTWICRVLGGQTVQSAYGIQNWSGEIDMWDIWTKWGYGTDQVVMNWDISFGVRDFSSPYTLRGPAYSNGTCHTNNTVTGGSISLMSDVYGLYFSHFKPSPAGSNGILYWLYEQNNFESR